MYSLKRLVWLAFLVVSILLAGIVLLGGYQYRLAGKYNQVISQNEKIIFHYMTVRESITAALISNNWNRLESRIVDIEKLNAEITRLKDNKLISPELKLALVDKIDLPGLAILIRQVINNNDKAARGKKLQEQLRSISDYLIQYDRIIVGQARQRIVDFQMVVIGAFGLIISLASFSLILLYRNTVSPLIQLSSQVQSDELLAEGIVLPHPVAKEVADLAQAVELLARKSEIEQVVSNDNKDSDSQLLADAVNETTNQLNGIINYAQLIYDSAEQLALGEEHKEMLQKIIESGSAIATEWQNLK